MALLSCVEMNDDHRERRLAGHATKLGTAKRRARVVG